MKFLKRLAALALGVMLISNTVFAIGVNTGTGSQNYLKKVGTDSILFIKDTYELGSVTNPVAKGYFTDLDVAGLFTFGGVMASDLDMAGFDIVNIDHLFGDSAPVQIGDAATTSRSLASEDDLLVTGDVEIDGATYLDGAFEVGEAGSGVDSRFYSASAVGSNTHMMIAGTDNDTRIRFVENGAPSTSVGEWFVGTGAMSFYSPPGSGRNILFWQNDTLKEIQLQVGANKMLNVYADRLEVQNDMPFLFGDGLVGTPAISFATDTDSGFYRSASNQFRAVANGAFSAMFAENAFYTNNIASQSGVELKMTGNDTDGATADGVVIGSVTNLTTAGANLVSVVNNSTSEVASIDYTGKLAAVGAEFSAAVTMNAGGGVTAGNLQFSDNTQLTFGDGNNTALDWSSAQATEETLLWGLASASSSLIFTDMANRGKDHDHAAQSNPTLFLHSATDPDTDNTQWLSLSHNQTNPVITSGKGAIAFASSATFLTGNVSYSDDVQLAFGSSNDSSLDWSTAQATQNTLVWGLNDTAKSLVFSAVANRNKDHDHAAQSNPTLFIHSATDPDTDNTQWVSLYHDGVDAQMDIGTGDFKIGNVTLQQNGNISGATISSSNGLYTKAGAAGTVAVRGTVADGSGVAATTLRSLNTLATAGDKITSFDNNTVEVGYVDHQGGLSTDGGRWHNVTTVNAATYDLLTDDYFVHVTYTATGAVTSLTLPTAQTVAGRTIVIKDAGGNATTFNITIDTEGAETIDGSATYAIQDDYSSVSLYSDGSNWFVY